MKSKSVENGIVPISLAITQSDHLALAVYLDSGAETNPVVRDVLSRIVCQGAITSRANAMHLAVINVVTVARAGFFRARRGARRIPPAHRTGGPGQ